VTTIGTPLHVLEEATREFCVSLKFKPDGTNTVTLTPLQSPQPLKINTPANFNVTPAPLTRIFTSDNYFRSQLVKIEAEDDLNLDDDPGQLNISVTPFAPAKTLFLLLDDNDAQVIKLQNGSTEVPPNDPPPVIELTEAMAGSSKNIKLSLAFVPSKELVNSPGSLEELTIVSSSAKVTVSSTAGEPASGGGWKLSFNNDTYANPTTVTLTATQDSDKVDDTVTVTITSTSHNVPTTPARTVTVKIIDDDQAAKFVNSSSGEALAGNSTTITEGATGTVGLLLAFDPGSGSSVTVTCSSANAKVAITDSPATYTFTGGGGSAGTNWNVAHPIHLTANHDDDMVDDSITITCTAPGGLAMGTFTVVNHDDDVPAAAPAP
jgi:hypothetical protein